MPSNQVSELFDSILGLIHLFSETPENLLGLVVEELNQNIIFIFEIQIDGSISHTGFLGDLRNGRLKETVLGKYLDRRLEYPMVFIVFSAFLIDGTPPGSSKWFYE